MKNYKYIFFLFISFCISAEVFPQLDSVYYQGPSQGSVSSGAMQTTDNFGTNESFQLPHTQKKARIFSSEPMFLDLDNSHTGIP